MKIYLKKVYIKLIAFMKAYMPTARANLSYFVAYKKIPNLNSPETFSEKLLWLSLNTYRNNPVILKLSDKYLVREYVEDMGYGNILNDVYNVWDDVNDIDFEKLPSRFALKRSQGWQTNILCSNKESLDVSKTKKTIKSWNDNQFLYDKMMADIGGISINSLEKYYICEEYLEQKGDGELVDYKIYCFNGEPKAILIIEDRFGEKKGVFMTPEWEFLSNLSSSYVQMDTNIEKPKSLEIMIEIAKRLSASFPFVRVDLYNIDGKIIFGELTFFPNGCVNMQETIVEGKSMGELLDISNELVEKNRRFR